MGEVGEWMTGGGGGGGRVWRGKGGKRGDLGSINLFYENKGRHMVYDKIYQLYNN